MTEIFDAERLSRTRPAHIPVLLAAMSEAERRALSPALKSARSKLPRRSWWEAESESHAAVQLWGLGALSTPTAVAQWLSTGVTRHVGTRPELLLACLEAGGRDNDWRADLAARLAAGREDGWRGLPYFPLIVHLVRTSGAPVPTTDAFVSAWVARSDRDQLPPRWREHQLSAEPRLIDRLRSDPFLPVLARRLVEVNDLYLMSDPDRPAESWPHVLNTFSREGIVDREELHTCALNALLRADGRTTDTASRLSVLAGLAAEPAECASRADTYSRLLVESHSTVAGHAQGVLIALHGAGLYSSADAVALSGEVLSRPEKKLVRAQLSWLERIVRAEPEHISAAVRLWAELAAAIDDATLRTRAEKLVTRYLPKADNDTRMDLAVAPEPEVEEPFDLPSPPAPAPLADIPATPDELADVYRWLSARSRDDARGGERFFDGLVRFAHADPAGLDAALRPALDPDLSTVRSIESAPRQRNWWGQQPWGPLTAAAIALGIITYRPSLDRRATVLGARMAEWAEIVLSKAPLPPCALATPTYDNGQLDAAELLERLRLFHAAGIRPGPIEFAQALVRVAPGADAATRAAATALGTPEARELAAVLAGQPPTDLPEPLRAARRGPKRRWDFLAIAAIEYPDPEVLARWDFWDSSVPYVVLLLAELPGQKGKAVHDQVMRALGGDDARYRTAGVDALVSLAAAGELQPHLLVKCLRPETPNKRLAGSLREAVSALGPHRAWPIIDAFLPVLLGEGGTNGLADVLAVAADCARRCGATADYPALHPLADRRGTTRLAAEARTLREVLNSAAPKDLPRTDAAPVGVA
ncbi:hypothetical protein ACWDOP_07180 [Nocardia sp. NPDC003693]